jgi:hypothetical protein
MQPPVHLPRQAALEPEADDRLGEVHQPPQVSGRRRPVHRGAQIIQVGREPCHPRLGLATVEGGLRPTGQSDEKGQVTVTHPNRVVELGQPLGREQPHRLQQPVARPAVVLADLQQRTIGQPSDQVQHLKLSDVGPAHNRFGGFEIERAREHRQPCQRQPFGVGQQTEAPRHRYLEAALSGGDATVPTGQQPEAVHQARRDLRGSQHPHPCRGELDRQRDPVQTSTDRRHRGRVVVGEHEVRSDLPGPHLKQPPRVRGPDRAGGPCTGLGHPQWGDPESRLTLDRQGLAAGGQHVQPRTRRRQLADQRGTRGHQMLAIVEHHQQVPVTELFGEGVDQRLSRLLADADGATHGCSHRGRIAHALQLHPAGPVGEPRAHVTGDLQREPRLATPTRAGQRDHTRVRDQPSDPGTFRVAADERRDPDRHLAPRAHDPHLAPSLRGARGRGHP